MFAPWRGRWDDPTAYPRTAALDHMAAGLRVGVSLYYLSFNGPVHFVPGFRATLVAVVLLDGVGLVSLKRLVAPRRVADKVVVVEQPAA